MDDTSGGIDSTNINSVLKPPKPRIPLKDIMSAVSDEDNTASRKRRVSFANVNRIKEFSAGAESMVVCHTPAYEEPFSMSSDSSYPSGMDTSTPAKGPETTTIPDAQQMMVKLGQHLPLQFNPYHPTKINDMFHGSAEIENIPLQDLQRLSLPKSSLSGMLNMQENNTVFASSCNSFEGMDFTKCADNYQNESRKSCDTKFSLGMDITECIDNNQYTQYHSTRYSVGMDLTECAFPQHQATARNSTRFSLGMDLTSVVGQDVSGFDCSSNMSAEASPNDSGALEFTDAVNDAKLAAIYSVGNADSTRGVQSPGNKTRFSCSGMDLTRAALSNFSTARRRSTRYSVCNMELTEVLNSSNCSGLEFTEVVNEPKMSVMATRHSINEMDLTKGVIGKFSRVPSNSFENTDSYANNLEYSADSEASMDFTKPVPNICVSLCEESTRNLPSNSNMELTKVVGQIENRASSCFAAEVTEQVCKDEDVPNLSSSKTYTLIPPNEEVEEIIKPLLNSATSTRCEFIDLSVCNKTYDQCNDTHFQTNHHIQSNNVSTSCVEVENKENIFKGVVTTRDKRETTVIGSDSMEGSEEEFSHVQVIQSNHVSRGRKNLNTLNVDFEHNIEKIDLKEDVPKIKYHTSNKDSIDLSQPFSSKKFNKRQSMHPSVIESLVHDFENEISQQNMSLSQHRLGQSNFEMDSMSLSAMELSSTNCVPISSTSIQPIIAESLIDNTEEVRLEMVDFSAPSVACVLGFEEDISVTADLSKTQHNEIGIKESVSEKSFFIPVNEDDMDVSINENINNKMETSVLKEHDQSESGKYDSSLTPGSMFDRESPKATTSNYQKESPFSTSKCKNTEPIDKVVHITVECSAEGLANTSANITLCGSNLTTVARPSMVFTSSQCNVSKVRGIDDSLISVNTKQISELESLPLSERMVMNKVRGPQEMKLDVMQDQEKKSNKKGGKRSFEEALEAENDTEESPGKQMCLSRAEFDLLSNETAPSFLMDTISAPNETMDTNTLHTLERVHSPPVEPTTNETIQCNEINIKTHVSLTPLKNQSTTEVAINQKSFFDHNKVAKRKSLAGSKDKEDQNLNSFSLRVDISAEMDSSVFEKYKQLSVNEAVDVGHTDMKTDSEFNQPQTENGGSESAAPLDPENVSESSFTLLSSLRPKNKDFPSKQRCKSTGVALSNSEKFRNNLDIDGSFKLRHSMAVSKADALVQHQKKNYFFSKNSNVKDLGRNMYACELIPKWVELSFSIDREGNIINATYGPTPKGKVPFMSKVLEQKEQSRKEAIVEYLLQLVRSYGSPRNTSDLLLRLQDPIYNRLSELANNINIICKYHNGTLKGNILTMEVVSGSGHFWMFVAINIKCPNSLRSTDVSISQIRIGEFKISKLQQIFDSVQKEANQLLRFACELTQLSY